MANLATKAGVEGNGFRIQAPLQYLSKAQIIQAGVARGVDYGLTVSCYQADEQGRAANAIAAGCVRMASRRLVFPTRRHISEKFARGVVLR